MKKIIKPFSIEEWRNGAKIETRNGRSVRILCTNAKASRCIIGLIAKPDEEFACSWQNDGVYMPYSISDYDLVIVEERWAEDKKAIGDGWTISKEERAEVAYYPCVHLNDEDNYDVFATEKYAKSAIAMARISQLIAHDARYGGAITEEEWRSAKIDKFGIHKYAGNLCRSTVQFSHYFLAFHTKEQRDLFLEENERLVKDYLMID